MPYTPGPWEIEQCSCGCARYGTSNGMFYQGSGYSLDDACLIAAAPEMLEALENCYRLLKNAHVQNYIRVKIQEGELLNTTLTQTRKTIAKANGV